MATEQRALAASAAKVRQADPDRYFSALFAPEPLRPFLLALYAFNYEIAHVAESVREPMLGEIRLEWWRETLEGARAGRPRAHDTAIAISALLARVDLPKELLAAMIDARAIDFSAETFPDLPALETYLDATSGNLIRLGARVLGAEAGVDEVAREAGLAYGLAGIVRAAPFHARRHKVFLPGDLLATAGLNGQDIEGGTKLAAVIHRLHEQSAGHLRKARAVRVAKRALPAILPGALVPLYLRRIARAGFDPFRATQVTIHRRQMRLLSAALRGRI